MFENRINSDKGILLSLPEVRKELSSVSAKVAEIITIQDRLIKSATLLLKTSVETKMSSASTVPRSQSGKSKDTVLNIDNKKK